jgi:hypothetical protein
VKSGIALDESARVQPAPQPPSFLSRFSPLAALILVLTASSGGCHVGESPGDTGDDGAPAADAGGGAGGDDGDGEPTPDGGGEPQGLCSGIATELPVQEETHPPGYDYSAAPGQGCLGDCHRDGAQDTSAGFVWTAGGALYTDATAGEAVAGATIVIVDAEGTEHSAVTSENGQFWFQNPIAYPAMTYACPDADVADGKRPMATPLGEGDGNCNASGTCHADSRPIFLTPP